MSSIATIGYEKSSIEAFIATLRRVGIRQILDVRELPLSRKHGFSKRALHDYLEDAGITYHHIKSLGDPKPGRDAAKSGDHKTFRKIFFAHMRTNAAKEGLRLAAGLASNKPSALVCFEREHVDCHRLFVAHALERNYGFSIEHLTVDLPVASANRNPRRRRCCPRQGHSARR